MRMSPVTIFTLFIVCAPAAFAAGPEDSIAHAHSDMLWPDHKAAYAVEVVNGPAWQFQALASVGLPPELAPNEEKAKTVRLVELDETGQAVARVGMQIERADGKTRLWLPLAGATKPRAKRRFLLFADGPEAVAKEHDVAVPSARSFDTLHTERDAEGVRVANQFFRVGQIEAGGGFPKEITFVHTGTKTDRFYFDDRLYRKEPRAFHLLRADAESQAMIVSQGPLRAVVKVVTHYRQGGKPTAANARATYWYEYRAGSPLIHVRAEVVQDKPEAWDELHFLQLSTKGTEFPQWMAGPDRSGRYTGSKKGQTVPRWGVMSNGQDAIGLLTKGTLIGYDDPHGYCSYFQFPVVRWTTKTHEFAGWIYIGPKQPHRVMQHWCERVTHPPKATIRKLDALQTARAKVAFMPDDPKAPLEKRYERAMWLRLLRRDPTKLSLDDVYAVTKTAQAFGGASMTPAEGQGERVDSVDLRASDDSLWIGNRHAIYRFDLTKGGRITEILDLTHGVDFIARGQTKDVPLWRLKLRLPDGKIATTDSRIVGETKPKITVDSTPAKGASGKAAGIESAVLKLNWPATTPPNRKGAVAASVHFELSRDDPRLRANLKIDNQLTDATLWEVEFPILSPLGRPGAVDVAVPRGNWGILSRSFSGGQGGFYPSSNWPMAYLSVTDGPCTLYLADHELHGRTKHFHLHAGGEFTFRFPPPDMGKPGADFDLGHTVSFGPIEGDWFDAARVYRRWALMQEWMKRGALHRRDDIPKKLRDGLCWLLLNGGPEDVVPKAIAAQEFLGVPIGIHWYNWHKIPFDDDYPHYKPTKDGVPEAVAKLKARGIYVMPYINGRLWDVDTKDFETVAKPACTKDIDGKPYVEVYGSGEKLVPMCPTTDVWQDKVCEIVDWLVNDVGVNAVYLDQIAAAGPRLCMDASHGHPLGGGSWWCPAYWKLMDRVQAIGAKKGPDVFFTTENNAECYAQNIDAFLVWNPRRPEMIPINAAVYGGMRVHFANRVNVADSAMAFAMKVGRDFLWGTQLGWMAPFYLEPQHKDKGVYFRRLAKARVLASKFLGYGQMLRKPTITCEETVTAEWFGHKKFEHTVTWPAVAGACWRAPDGHIGLIFTNYDTQPHAFAFRPSAEAVGQMGEHALWCERTERGLHHPPIVLRADKRYHVKSIPPRSVLALEVIPCKDADEQRGRGRRLLRPRKAPDTPAPKAAAFEAALKVQTQKTAAGEPALGHIDVTGPAPKGEAWRLRVDLPDDYAVEPAPMFPLQEGAGQPRKIGVMIHPPATAEPGPTPIRVELTRPLDEGQVEIAPRK